MATPGGYSLHFSRRELLFSETAARHGIDNTPGPLIERNLVRICTDLLEPIHEHFGAIAISAGYRCPALNAVVRGSKASADVEGRAADLRPVECTISLSDLARWVQVSGLPYDHVIYEFGGWVHVAVARPGGAPRHQALMFFEPGEVHCVRLSEHTPGTSGVMRRASHETGEGWLVTWPLERPRPLAHPSVLPRHPQPSH